MFDAAKTRMTALQYGEKTIAAVVVVMILNIE